MKRIVLCIATIFAFSGIFEADAQSVSRDIDQDLEMKFAIGGFFIPNEMIRDYRVGTKQFQKRRIGRFDLKYLWEFSDFLGLNKDQTGEINEWSADLAKRAVSMKQEDLRVEVRQKLNDVLSKEQVKKARALLFRLHIYDDGLEGALKDVSGPLGLSKKQAKELEKISTQIQTDLKKDLQKLEQKYTDKYLDALSLEQQEKIRELLGDSSSVLKRPLVERLLFVLERGTTGKRPPAGGPAVGGSR